MIDQISFGTTDRGTANQVCNMLREAIITKSLAQGERLVESKIASDHHVSITPVRQAFNQLATEGLLEAYPFKGTYVTTLTEQKINETLYVRDALELAAAALFFDKATEKDIAALSEYCEQMRYYSDTEPDTIKSVEADMLFHSLFFERADNETLLKLWNNIKSLILFIMYDVKPPYLKPSHSYDRHVKIVEALKTKDKKAFLDTVSYHISSSQFFSPLYEKIQKKPQA